MQKNVPLLTNRELWNLKKELSGTIRNLYMLVFVNDYMLLHSFLLSFLSSVHLVTVEANNRLYSSLYERAITDTGLRLYPRKVRCFGLRRQR